MNEAYLASGSYPPTDLPHMAAAEQFPTGTIAAGKNNASQFVGFQLADQEYLFPIEQIQEVVILKQVTKTPQVPRYVEGVANLRGRLFRSLTFVNLFGLWNPKADADTRTIVVNAGRKEHGLHGRYGVAGDANSHESIRPPETITANGAQYVAGFARLNGRLMIVLDINELLEPGKLDHINATALQDPAPRHA